MRKISQSERTLAKIYAKQIELTDVEAFAWLLGLELTHDNEASVGRQIIVDALRHYSKCTK